MYSSNIASTIITDFTFEAIYDKLKLSDPEMSFPNMVLFKDEFLFFIQDGKLHHKNVNTDSRLDIPDFLGTIDALTICGEHVVCVVQRGFGSKFHSTCKVFYLVVFTYLHNQWTKREIDIGHGCFYGLITAVDDNSVAVVHKPCYKEDDMVTVFNIGTDNATAKKEFTFGSRHYRCLTSVSLGLIACGYQNDGFIFGRLGTSGLLVFDCQHGKEVFKYEASWFNPITPICKVIALENQLVLGWCEDSKIKGSCIHIWDFKSKQEVECMKFPNTDINDMIKLKDGCFAVVKDVGKQSWEINIYNLSSLLSYNGVN